MLIDRLVLKNWRQFAELDIRLHQRLTVLVGPNGSGKSVALRLLGSHYAGLPAFAAVPTSQVDSGFRPDVFLRPNVTVDLYPLEKIPFGPLGFRLRMGSPIGNIVYSNGQDVVLSVALDQPSAQYKVFFMGELPAVAGCHIPAHRAHWNYAPVEENELLADLSPSALLESVKSSCQDPDVRLFPFQVKRALLSLLNQDAKPELLIEFENILKRLLPKEIDFQSFFRVGREVGINADQYQFSLDSVSGGMSSIVCIAWVVFLQSKLGEFMVSIDEPENHLHPSLQKTFLSGLVDQFPSGRFVVATHSPFVVTACEDSHVIQLHFRPHPIGIESSMLSDPKTKSLTPDDIFRSVLGLEYVMPEWAAVKLQQITEKHKEKPITSATLTEIAKDLENAGLANNMSESLNLVVEDLNDKNQERP